jgi:hypothetical protein
MDLVAQFGVTDQRPSLTSGLLGARSTRGPEDRAMLVVLRVSLVRNYRRSASNTKLDPVVSDSAPFLTVLATLE